MDVNERDYEERHNSFQQTKRSTHLRQRKVNDERQQQKYTRCQHGHCEKVEFSEFFIVPTGGRAPLNRELVIFRAPLDNERHLIGDIFWLTTPYHNVSVILSTRRVIDTFDAIFICAECFAAREIFTFHSQMMVDKSNICCHRLKFDKLFVSRTLWNSPFNNHNIVTEQFTEHRLRAIARHTNASATLVAMLKRTTFTQFVQSDGWLAFATDGIKTAVVGSIKATVHRGKIRRCLNYRLHAIVTLGKLGFVGGHLDIVRIPCGRAILTLHTIR